MNEATEFLVYDKIVEHDRGIALSDDITLTVRAIGHKKSRVILTIGGECGRKLLLSRLGKSLRRNRPGKPKVRKKD